MTPYILQFEVADGSLLGDVHVRTKAAAITAARALARSARQRIAEGFDTDILRYLVCDAKTEMTVFVAPVRR